MCSCLERKERRDDNDWAVRKRRNSWKKLRILVIQFQNEKEPVKGICLYHKGEKEEQEERSKERHTDISEDLDHWRWMGVRFLPYMRVRPSVHKRGKKNRQLLGLCPSSSEALPMSFLSPQLQFQTLRSALLQSQHNFWSSEHALTNRQRALGERHLEGFQLADNITRRNLN